MAGVRESLSLEGLFKKVEDFQEELLFLNSALHEGCC